MIRLPKKYLIRYTQEDMFSFFKLLKSTSVVGVGTILSRLAGWGREICMTAWMGTSAATDAIVVATRIPTLLRKISTEGSLNGVLIPLIDDLEKKHHKQVVINLINKIIIIFSATFIGFFLIETMQPEGVLHFLAPGILQDPQRLYWFSSYIPFTSLTILFFFLSGLFSAMLNYNQKFFWPAIAPFFWNMVLIGFIIYAQIYKLSFYILGPAFLVATIVQCSITFSQYVRLRIPFKIRRDIESKKILRTFFRNFFPVMFSASISQINSMILIILTSYLPLGNTTLLHRAERLLQVPIGIILALSTTLLPTLTKTHETEDASKIIKSSLILSAVIFVPTSFIFYFFAGNIVSLIFHYGRCTTNDILVISGIVKIYAFGLPAFLLLRVMPIFFFARKEVKITTKGAIIHTISNIVLSVMFMQKFGAQGLAWANVASSWLHILWLTYNVFRKKYI